MWNIITKMIVPPPVARVATRDAKPQSPEVVSVGKEQLPEPVPRWDRPHALTLQLPAMYSAFYRVSNLLDMRWAARSDAFRIFVALTALQIQQIWRQARLGYEDFTSMHTIAPFFGWKQWNGIVDMCYSPVGASKVGLM